jgi:hypothetical protein
MKSTIDGVLRWRGLTSGGEEWFSSAYDLHNLKRGVSTDDAKSKILEDLFFNANMRNPDFLLTEDSLLVDSILEFPRDWGLGSSSTLVHLIAQWAEVDAFQLQQDTFGGSGYDVMVAAHGCSIVFSRKEDKPIVQEVQFDPPFKDKLWFVHCGHKQDSAKEVKRFEDLKVTTRDIDHVSRITDELVEVQDVMAFERLLWEHDFLLSRILGQPAASEEFPDYRGLVKYLGAWGGDFMLAVGEESDMDFFREKGMNSILSYQDMIKQ